MILGRTAIALAAAGLFLACAFGATVPIGSGTIAWNPLGGVVCTEITSTTADTGGGCTGTITNITLANGTIMTLTVGSDSEGHWDPFGYGADTSDGINFSFDQANTTVTNFSSGGWTRFKVDGTTPIPSGSGPTYVLPADLTAIGCGTENETICEPFGIFGLNTPIIGTGGGVLFRINDAVGLSDEILLYNSPTLNGNGVVALISDPIPEPATFIFSGAALVVVALLSRRRRTHKV
jgi:hypothetical protein